MNLTIFQFFHWYTSSETSLWKQAGSEAQFLADVGITHVWLPPAYKSALGTAEPGYAVYDVYDLGEFDQKETVRTKYGTKEEYLGCIHSLHEKGLSVLADIVLNHKMGADEQETIPVQQVQETDRNDKVAHQKNIAAYTRFTFPGREGRYSDFIWDWRCFTGISKGHKIYLILNEWSNGSWEEVMEDEYGNYDYLMGCDLEFRSPAVREEAKSWGKWYVETTGIDGFRLDAIKHISTDFYPEWLGFLKETFKKDFFCIGEYWKADNESLLQYMEATSGLIQLFDVPLHFNFHTASKEGELYDLRTIFENTLVQSKPEMAITFVDNHDTQPLQSLESWVEPWFKPHAYALILLRQQGIPCIFYPDFYGAHYTDSKEGKLHEVDLPQIGELEWLIKCRTLYAVGDQQDYFEDPHTVGWVRFGNEGGNGLAVLINSSGGGAIAMNMGEANKGRSVFNILGDHAHKIDLDEAGGATFSVDPGKIAVWIFSDSQ